MTAQIQSESKKNTECEEYTVHQSDISQNSLTDKLTVSDFDYKKTKEWKRFKLLRGLGIGAVTVGILGTWLSAEFCTLSRSYEGILPAGIVSLSIMGSILLASVPLFIYANKYKKRALEMNVAVSALSVPYNLSVRTSPGVTFAFSF